MPNKCNIFLIRGGRGNGKECTDVRNAAEGKSREEKVEMMWGREGLSLIISASSRGSWDLKKGNTHQTRSRKGVEMWECRTPGEREESPGSRPLGSGPVLSFQNKDTSGGQKYLRKTLQKEAWEVWTVLPVEAIRYSALHLFPILVWVQLQAVGWEAPLWRNQEAAAKLRNPSWHHKKGRWFTGESIKINYIFPHDSPPLNLYTPPPTPTHSLINNTQKPPWWTGYKRGNKTQEEKVLWCTHCPHHTFGT